jgi:hypothetical protein
MVGVGVGVVVGVVVVGVAVGVTVSGGVEAGESVEVATVADRQSASARSVPP